MANAKDTYQLQHARHAEEGFQASMLPHTAEDIISHVLHTSSERLVRIHSPALAECLRNG